jgi:hypothetical protein
MKNIHLIPTDKPSSLFEIDGHLIINKEQLIQPKYYRNIYITNDEEIKEGDWFYSVRELIEKAIINYPKGENFGKIILTTDQDLIKDSVQAIGDEFLEWFVKNPSCEWIEVIKIDVEQPKPLYPNGNHKGERVWIEQYKIIIPQEEPKQESFVEKMIPLQLRYNLDNIKQATLEEAAEIFVNNRFAKQISGDKTYPDIYASKEAIIESHILFAKWQQERMYSEEEVKDIVEQTIEKFYKHRYSDKTKAEMKELWFEQFKKK